jgi:DNA-binding Xre family transcriptional regulator
MKNKVRNKPKIKTRFFQQLLEKVGHDTSLIDAKILEISENTNISKNKLTMLANNKHVNFEVYELVKIAESLEVSLDSLIIAHQEA